jgi:hypothetical protein
MVSRKLASHESNRGPVGGTQVFAANEITLVCGECGGSGCKKCNHSGTVTIVE